MARKLFLARCLIELVSYLLASIVHVLESPLVLAIRRLVGQLENGGANESEDATDADDGSSLDHFEGLKKCRGREFVDER